MVVILLMVHNSLHNLTAYHRTQILIPVGEAFQDLTALPHRGASRLLRPPSSRGLPHTRPPQILAHHPTVDTLVINLLHNLGPVAHQRHLQMLPIITARVVDLIMLRQTVDTTIIIRVGVRLLNLLQQYLEVKATQARVNMAEVGQVNDLAMELGQVRDQAKKGIMVRRAPRLFLSPEMKMAMMIMKENP